MHGAIVQGAVDSVIRLTKYLGIAFAVLLFALMFSVVSNGAALKRVAAVSRQNRVLVQETMYWKNRADSLERLVQSQPKNRGGSE